jgi:surface carbohydrate biosynthesis protein
MGQFRRVPTVIALPFFSTSRETALQNYLRRWPNANYLNVAWEQILYKGQRNIKAAADDFARHKVIHHAWGQFYRKFLLEHGVTEDNVFLNGNPVYQLYLDPYKQYYRDRSWLASEYGLDEEKRWVFIPENYRWAFQKSGWIKKLAERGGDTLEDLLRMREFSADSLTELLKWCNQTSQNGKLELIFRPKPATMLQEMISFFYERVSETKPACLHFKKGESVREWILASDVVISSFSTTLIEAAIAGKPVFMVEPVPLIEAFHNDWYHHVARIRNEEEFEEACLEEKTGRNRALKNWAKNEMLADGDPIVGLAGILSQLAGNSLKRADLRSEVIALIEGSKQLTRCVLGRDKDYFNFRTNENDIFCDDLVHKRTHRWSEVLFNN